MARDHRELRVFQEADALAIVVYRVVNESFPSEERYGLSSQMKRAAVSVAANIAEGCQRGTDKDFAYFLRISAGSASEVGYMAGFSKRSGTVRTDEVLKIEDRYRALVRQLHRFIDSMG